MVFERPFAEAVVVVVIVVEGFGEVVLVMGVVRIEWWRAVFVGSDVLSQDNVADAVPPRWRDNHRRTFDLS